MFLDEVGELPLGLQTKLLRVLQDRQVRPVGSSKTFQVDVRLIAATNRRLDEAVRDGDFRQDLFYRLNVVRIEMPPLRERKADLPSLVHHCLQRLNTRFGREVQGVAPGDDGVAALRFPRNVRELENCRARSRAGAACARSELDDIPVLGRAPGMRCDTANAAHVAEMERELIARALPCRRR